MQPVIDGQYFLMDRTLKSVSYYNASLTPDSICVYEVFRIERFKALFLNEHLKRLKNTLRIAEIKPHINVDRLPASLNMLFSANNIENGNVKLEFRSMPNREMLFMAYFIETNYPDASTISEGIRCSLQFSERHHPEAKIYNPTVRNKADNIIEQQEVYETLLVNSENYLTEGSRSNLFFIHENELITADESMVLSGIMRMQVIKTASKLGINIRYQAVNIDELNQMDAAFISGTTPRILPIQQVADKIFPVDTPIFLKLKEGLSKLIEEEIG
jgi:branched-chain amino acid aminotransferase